MAAGRPSSYTERKANLICTRLMMGESLRSICERKYYPSKVTVLSWLQKFPQFLTQYTHAREIQQEHYLDEMFEIADDASNDWMERVNGEGDNIGWQINGEHVQRSRLRIDTRKWVMERMAAKKYGPKKSLDHTSSDGSMSVDGMTSEERQNRIAQLMNKAK